MSNPKVRIVVEPLDVRTLADNAVEVDQNSTVVFYTEAGAIEVSLHSGAIDKLPGIRVASRNNRIRISPTGANAVVVQVDNT